MKNYLILTLLYITYWFFWIINLVVLFILTFFKALDILSRKPEYYLHNTIKRCINPTKYESDLVINKLLEELCNIDNSLNSILKVILTSSLFEDRSLEKNLTKITNILNYIEVKLEEGTFSKSLHEQSFILAYVQLRFKEQHFPKFLIENLSNLVDGNHDYIWFKKAITILSTLPFAGDVIGDKSVTLTEYFAPITLDSIQSSCVLNFDRIVFNVDTAKV